MPIKSKTWPTTPGLNYIQDSELAFATLYSVKREGTGHDIYVSGDTNRKHIFTSSTGTIAFPNPFSAGERVFAIYKPAVSIPDIPPCTAVAEPVADTLHDGIEGQPYSKIIFLTGTPPFVLTGITKPAWMTITNSTNTISLFGTPNVTGTQNVIFDITNCGGSVNFNQSFEVLQAANNFTIQNQVPGALIQSLTNLNFVATSGLVYPPPFQTMTGVHDAYAGIPTMAVTIGPFPFSLRFFINSIPIQFLSVTANGSYPFTLVTSYTLSDDLLIQLTT